MRVPIFHCLGPLLLSRLLSSWPFLLFYATPPASVGIIVLPFLALSLSLSPQGLVAAEVATSARFVPMVTNRVKINMMHCLHVLSPRHVLRAERFTRCTIFHVTPSP